MENAICKLFGIRYPIVQGGMVWISGAKLAAAVSQAGGLGLIGSGSMPAELLREHIRKAKTLTDKPFGVNVPMLYSKVDQTIEVMEQEGVKIIFTSAGNPASFTPMLKAKVLPSCMSSPAYVLPARRKAPAWMRWWPKALKPEDTTGARKRLPWPLSRR